MFDSDTTIIYITFDSIWVKGNSEEHKLFQINRHETTLEQAFADIKKALDPQSVRLLIGTDISYTLALQTPNTITQRDQALGLAKTHIPEELTTTNFDWQVIKDSQDNHLLQLFALNQEFLSEIKATANASEIEVEVIEPIATVLKNLTRADQRQTYYIAWVRWEPQIILVHNNAVLHAQNLIGYNVEEFSRVHQFLNQQFSQIQPTEVLYDWPENSNLKALEALNIPTITPQPINPFERLKKEKTPEGDDKEFLYITLKKSAH